MDKNRLLEYQKGLKLQHAEALKQAHMIEGALQLIEQLLSDIKEGEQSPSEAEQNEDDEL